MYIAPSVANIEISTLMSRSVPPDRQLAPPTPNPEHLERAEISGGSVGGGEKYDTL